MILQQILLRPTVEAVSVSTFTSLGSIGTKAFNNDTLAFNPNKNIAAGTMLVATYVQSQFNNTVPVVTDTKGNTWEAGGNYQSASVWYCKVTNALTTTDVINFSGPGTTSRIASIEQFAIPNGMNVYRQGFTIAFGSGNCSPPMTQSALPNRTYLFVRHIGIIFNGVNGGDITPTAGFTGMEPSRYFSGNAADYIFGRGEYIVSTGTGITSDPSDSFGNTNSANILTALYLAA